MKTNKDNPPVLSSNAFPVVGIGASAGGLDAFKKLLKAIPEDSGMAYVLVQHLDPSHESLLPSLLQKVTKIPVLEISDDIKVLPDHIYIIPSNKMLLANDGVLQLSPRPEKNKNERNLPIDLFFTSLAEVHQSHAIGVVLSGTASDGTKGLRAIKDHGGLTFAQDEASAAYEEMPQSAAQAGVVDFILPPDQIPAKLIEIKQQVDRGEREMQNIPAQEENVFKKILSLLRMRKGTDFTYYKQTTIRRRIFRRMLLNKKESVTDYLTYLRNNKTEQDALYQDLLIPVTAFFRDHAVFDHLCESVFPQIVKNKMPGEPIRVWIAACSTGEEAYSVAICLKEFLGDGAEKAQVFATDISEPAIAKARAGMYKKSETEGLTTQRLNEFFAKTGDHYQINKEVRDMCVFAVHNFLKDPPFGKIDLVSCRNVLIYMEPYLQKKALTTFHYALQPKGFLLLGRSETSASVPELFASTSKTDKLFTRKNTPARFMHVASPRIEQHLYDLTEDSASEKRYTDFQKTADEIMLRRYTPAGVVVNEAMDIVHFRGNTNTYLEQAPGKPSHNLLKMAKFGLSFELRNILHKAKKEKTAIIKKNIPLQVDGSQRMITIDAIPLPNIVEPHYLILFYDTAVVVNPKKANSQTIAGQKDENLIRIQQLEKELVQTREDMRSITEEQEAANEELQSANEELLSGSEELQSLNEELETSKEELQSTNEELTSLNEQVNIARHYAESIIATLREPVLVLDKTLRVKTANAAFYTTFHVNEQDTEGTLIYDLGNKQWNIPQLRVLLEEILPQKTTIADFEVTHDFPVIGERSILLNAKELIREKTEEKLILMAMEDITERKQLVNAKNRIMEIQHEHGKELEQKVQQRTIELSAAIELLYQKNEALKKMNLELESFTFISSHDLQEPLRKIQTFADRILEKDFTVLSDSGKDYFTRMRASARHMQKLIEDLLAYSHTSIVGRKLETVDLTEIAGEVTLQLAEHILQKGAVITTGKLDSIYSNHFQIRNVFNNLLANALKFSKPGIAPHIIIKSKIASAGYFQSQNTSLAPGCLPLGQNYCHISFSDNGIGFDPQYKNKIFEVFQRLHNREEYVGTGIGLAIVKKIIENHNGFITATGELGKGATFDIYIPVLPV
jgi:two-component system CheB/CheR fusion protein